MNAGVIELARLEVRRNIRDRRTLIFTIFFPVIFYVLFTNSNKGGDLGGVGVDRYLMISMATYGAVGAVLMRGAMSIAAQRQTGWTRQLRITPLPSWGYLVAKVAGMALVSLPSIVLVLIAGAAFNHVRLAVWQWIAAALVLWLCSMVFAALAVLLGYAITPEGGQPIMMIVYFGLSLLGGLWWPVETMPRVMRDIANVMPTHHVQRLGVDIVSGSAPYWGNIVVLVAFFVVFGIGASFMYLRDTKAN